MDFLKTLSIDPIQFVYGALAICGGVARYLSGYTTDGLPFKFRTFVASTFVSGFSGYMFALLGLSMSLPPTFLFIMSGTGGFFGEQTMKLILEYVQVKVPKA